MTEKQYYQLDLVAVFSPVEEFGRFIYVENPAASLWFKGRLLLVPVAVLDDGDARQLLERVGIDHDQGPPLRQRHELGERCGLSRPARRLLRQLHDGPGRVSMQRLEPRHHVARRGQQPPAASRGVRHGCRAGAHRARVQSGGRGSDGRGLRGVHGGRVWRHHGRGRRRRLPCAG